MFYCPVIKFKLTLINSQFSKVTITHENQWCIYGGGPWSPDPPPFVHINLLSFKLTTMLNFYFCNHDKIKSRVIVIKFIQNIISCFYLCLTRNSDRIGEIAPSLQKNCPIPVKTLKMFVYQVIIINILGIVIFFCIFGIIQCIHIVSL